MAIDYKNYLKGLGEIEANQEKIIKTYLEKQCESDPALKSAYIPEKISDCYKFITEAARNLPRTNSCVCVTDEVVFKMARDYFLEILPAETKAETAAAVETEAETEPEKMADNENSGTQQEETAPENENSGESAVSNQEEGGEEEAEEEPEAEAAENTQTEAEAEPEAEAAENTQTEAEDDVVRDELGFEIFGEKPEKTDSETEAETEPANTADNENSGTQEDKEDENVFFAGQAYSAGEIIDHAGRKLQFSELVKGMRFVYTDPKMSINMIVAIVLSVKDDMMRYTFGSGDCVTLQKNVDSEGVDAIFAVPVDAKVVGTYTDGKRVYLEEGESKRPEKKYDEEGNGLLFGF